MDKFKDSGKKEEKKYVLCPICKGTGLCEQDDLAIRNDEIFNILPSKNGIEERPRDDARYSWSDGIREKENPSSQNIQQGHSQDLASIMEHFLDDPKDDQNPSETLRTSIQKLKKNQPDQNLSALKDVLFISKNYPELVEPVMSIVYRKLASLLQNTRFQVVGLSAHLTAQFFKVTQYAQRPEFDELAAAILQKTAHMNKHVREISNKTLETMVSYVPYAHCVRILTSPRGAGHKNPEVRAAVSRLIENVVRVIGEKTLLNAPQMKDTRCKIFTALAKFLIDGNLETRANARKQVKHLFKHSEFENSFHQCIDLKLYEKVQKDFIALKYDCMEKNNL
ncbi:hypothetical protein QAD02_023902 [Eretmocerus hayati]|uniref:Uncharacterized protein n=1 Tax=Eretmocerus hayati TaxID=131215 RepID=A0ACC2Q0K9_9HYME|nr:hypothetical protein QAD02_023902 [Eretmocerus hayati]